MSAYGNAGGSRFDEMTHFGSGYSTPGWQRAKRRGGFGGGGFEEEDASQDYESYDSTDMGARSGGARSSRGSSTGRGHTTSGAPPPLRGRAKEGGGAFSTGGKPFGRDAARRRGPLTIEGELVAKSTGTVSAFTIGDRVFHQKFGNGNVVNIDGNKLTIQFDKAGEKRVVDSFVERV